MRVAVLTDPGNADGTIGGAQLTMREFVEAKPDDVEVSQHWLGAGSLDNPDAVVLGNVVGFTADDLVLKLSAVPRVVWIHNDLSPWIDSDLRAWLDRYAEHVFCSPLHQKSYRWTAGSEVLPSALHLIPPAIDLKRFKPSRQVKRNGDRKGMVALGAWQNQGKGQQSLLEHAREHGPIDVYGTGQFAPTQPPLNFVGAVDYKDVPELLWGYETFVHLPWEVEPFGRAVVEAHAAGLDIVANRNVGALYWLNEAPEKLETAAEDFWKVVLS